MDPILKLIRVTLGVDVGVVVFTLLEHRPDWFWSSQLALFSTLLIIVGSMVGYRKLVEKRAQLGGAEFPREPGELEDRWGLWEEKEKKEMEEVLEIKQGENLKGEKKEKNTPSGASISQTGEEKSLSTTLHSSSSGSGTSSSTSSDGVPPLSSAGEEKKRGRKTSLWEKLSLGIGGAFTPLRILGYGALIVSFIILQKKGLFAVVPFLFGVSLPPALLFILGILERKEK